MYPDSTVAVASAMLLTYTEFWICCSVTVIEPCCSMVVTEPCIKNSVYVYQQLGKLLMSTTTTTVADLLLRR
jgi:hypothetical protein